jgi:hypothetical protein
LWGGTGKKKKEKEQQQQQILYDTARTHAHTYTKGERTCDISALSVDIVAAPQEKKRKMLLKAALQIPCVLLCFAAPHV